MRFDIFRGNGGAKAPEVKQKLRIREQKKLEKMVAELFSSGRRNIGEDLRILKQSCKLDKLIVNEMMLAEMKKNYTN